MEPRAERRGVAARSVVLLGAAVVQPSAEERPLALHVQGQPDLLFQGQSVPAWVQELALLESAPQAAQVFRHNEIRRYQHRQPPKTEFQLKRRPATESVQGRELWVVSDPASVVSAGLNLERAL